MRTTECFKIRIAVSEDPFNIKKSKTCKTIRSSKSHLSLNPITIEADPFLFVHKEVLYLFFESKKFNEPAEIKMVSTNDLKTWSKPRTVLKENFHLSYPFIFEDNGIVYMIPETCEDNCIRLYQANQDLTHFTLKKKLITQSPRHDININFSDSSIIQRNNIYYLMTTVNYSGTNTLELYTSDSLFGEYKKHPKSPILRDNKLGRNGGCLFEYKGSLYRPSQDCTNRYGDDVQISKIEELSLAEYSERVIINNLLSSKLPFYKDGGHHCNITYFKNYLIQATDAKEYIKFPVALAWNKLKRIFKGYATNK